MHGAEHAFKAPDMRSKRAQYVAVAAAQWSDRHVVHEEPAESVVGLASDEPTMQMLGVRRRDWPPAVAAAQWPAMLVCRVQTGVESRGRP